MSTPMTHRSWACCLVIAVTLPTALRSQVPGATLVGRVVQKSDTSHAVAGAQIILGVDERHVVTDSSGSYLLGGIPAGVHHVVVRALGFRPVEFSVTLHEGLQSLEDIPLDVRGRRAGARARRNRRPRHVSGELPTGGLRASPPDGARPLPRRHPDQAERRIASLGPHARDAWRDGALCRQRLHHPDGSCASGLRPRLHRGWPHGQHVRFVDSNSRHRCARGVHGAVGRAG